MKLVYLKQKALDDLMEKHKIKSILDIRFELLRENTFTNIIKFYGEEVQVWKSDCVVFNIINLY